MDHHVPNFIGSTLSDPWFWANGVSVGIIMAVFGCDNLPAWQQLAIMLIAGSPYAIVRTVQSVSNNGSSPSAR